MEAEDPLKDLADIHLPDPVSLWPPAPGWWVVGVLLALGLVWLGLRWLRRQQRLARMRAALAALEKVHREYDQGTSPALDANAAGLHFLHGCNEVLKRVALVHYPATDVAALSGSAWLGFLDAHGETSAFSTGTGRVLGDASYRPRFDGDPQALHKLCAAWVRRQYRADVPPSGDNATVAA